MVQVERVCQAPILLNDGWRLTRGKLFSQTMAPRFTSDLQPNRLSHMITTPLNTGYTTNKRAIMDGHSTPQVSQRLTAIVAILALYLGLAATTQSDAAGVWTNEPAGAAVVLDCPFSSTPSSCGILDVYSSSIQDTDGTASVSPSGVIRSTISAGNNTGGMQIGYAIPQTHREFFMGLMWRTNPQFTGRTVNDKMFFIRGPETNAYFGMRGCRVVRNANSGGAITHRMSIIHTSVAMAGSGVIRMWGLHRLPSGSGRRLKST